MGKTLGSGRYVKDAKLGEGTFGAVYKALDTRTGQSVAVKQIYVSDSDRGRGVNVTALREIKLLKELQHDNVIRLFDVFLHKGNLNLVFELMDTDLEAIIRDQSLVLSPGDIKAYMHMTLKALSFCHSKWVLHRDMKPNNLFLHSSGLLKLGDFGLARIFGSPNPRLTHEVFATWYRAPELLFGSKAYGPAVDVWGAACVFAELLLRQVFLPGESVLDQLGKIFSKFGTPKESTWPGVSCLPDFVEFYPSPPQPLRSFFPHASDDCLDLLSRMFSLDPNKRISAKDALQHRYFTSAPPPTSLAALPRPLKRRERARAELGLNQLPGVEGEGAGGRQGSAETERADGNPKVDHETQDNKLSVGEFLKGRDISGSALKSAKRKLDDMFDS